MREIDDWDESGSQLLALGAVPIIPIPELRVGFSPRCLAIDLCVSVGSFRPGTLASGSQI